MQQPKRPTVGDTVTIVRRILARPGTVIEARPPIDSAIATLISSPVLTRDGDSVQIAYTVAVWTAGRNDLVLPGAVIVDQRGHVDTLGETHVTLDVASVLPASKSASTIKPQSARPWLPRADRSELPFVVLVPLVLLLLGLVHWRWRRLGPVPGTDAPPVAAIALNDTRLNAWLAAGESRLALEHLDALVRNRSEFADWRVRVAAVRFAPGDDATAAVLVHEARTRIAALTP